MPTLDWNIKTWGEYYNWKDMGEEWSAIWGGSEAQWFGSLLPRLHRFLPCNNVLELACGFGRWTKFILPLTMNKFVGIDIAENCIKHCKQNFGSKKAAFFQNDGSSLELADKIKYNLVFSFDSLVHADIEVLRKYIPQIIGLLAEDGVCFIHHSNFGQFVPPGSNLTDHIGFKHCRDQSSTAEEVKNIVEQHDGKLILQELVSWEGDSLIDCFTLFARKESKYEAVKNIIPNFNFMGEANICRNIFQLYNLNKG
jgi:SAM-dependent methyltransferase